LLGLLAIEWGRIVCKCTRQMTSRVFNISAAEGEVRCAIGFP
jgi:hypothetical protein